MTIFTMNPRILMPTVRISYHNKTRNRHQSFSIPNLAMVSCLIALLFCSVAKAGPIPADLTTEAPSLAYIDRLRSEGHTEQEIASYLSTTQPSTPLHPTPAFLLAADSDSDTSIAGIGSIYPATSTSAGTDTHDTSSLTIVTPPGGLRRRISRLFRFTTRKSKRDTSGDVSPSSLTSRSSEEAGTKRLVLIERIKEFMASVLGTEKTAKRSANGLMEDGMGGTVLRPRGQRQWFRY
ncbi:hypothetical protein EV356DRAFT_575605 [Viridothelium virens]|uniref:Uncharacterized protein n=1 Tax=Viridothelium virens TaxID=1048519 RepID=A0A6A6HD44_VIRVR|nr:hypothetical protein EV356DRAFT_575605 [Viridothelium virens]